MYKLQAALRINCSLAILALLTWRDQVSVIVRQISERRALTVGVTKDTVDGGFLLYRIAPFSSNDTWLIQTGNMVERWSIVK